MRGRERLFVQLLLQLVVVDLEASSPATCAAKSNRFTYPYKGRPQCVDTIGVNGRKLYSFGGAIVAQREGNGTLTYFHGDLGGSVSVATKADGTLSSRQEFDPWGQRALGRCEQHHAQLHGAAAR